MSKYIKKKQIKEWLYCVLGSIVIMILCSSFGSAEWDYVNLNVGPTAYAGFINPTGQHFNTYNNYTGTPCLQAVNKTNGDTATTIHLKGLSGSAGDIANATFSGNQALFNSCIPLNVSTRYYVLKNSNGATYNLQYSTTALGWPKRNGLINWSGAWNGGDDSNGYGIEYINISFITTPSTLNFSITGVTDAYFGTAILNYTATADNGSIYYSNITSGILTTDILSNSTRLWNFTLSAQNYDTQTNYSINISSDKAFKLNFSYYKLNVTAFRTNGSAINIFNITLNTGESQATTNGIMIFNLTKNANYTAIIDAQGYAIPSAINISMNSYLVNKNFTLYTTNSIQFNFKNQSELPVYNVSIELISNSITYNYTTNPNATLYIDLITPESYQILYSNPNYPQGYYSFTLTNRSYNNLTLYFISGAYSNITAFVYDELGNIKPDSIIEVYRYNSLTHNYQFEQQAITNFQGKAILYLTKFNTFYKFNIKYNGVLRLATQPTYILDDVITFNFEAISSIGETFFNLDNVVYSLIYNNDTNNFRLIYNDLSASTITSACLDITKLYNGQMFTIGQSCNNGYAGTILYNITPQNGTTFIATANAYWNNQPHFLAQLTKTFTSLLPVGKAGLFYAVLLTIVLAFTALYSPVLALIVTPLPMLLFSVIGFIDLGWGILAFIEVIAIILAIILMRNK